MKEYYSTEQVAKKLGVTRVIVHRWIVQGKVKAIRVGRSFAVAKKEVERIKKIRELGLWR